MLFRISSYAPKVGWHHPRIVPYQPVVLDPSAKVFHYGQTAFEGMKAYRAPDDAIALFRPRRHLQRLNRSNARLGIPPIDEEFVWEALKRLVLLERDWLPSQKGASLYIRPFIIPTEPALGVAPSGSYRFMIILSPVGAYYPEGMAPVGIHVETEYVRAAKGGIGSAKTAGNYAASLKAQEGASAKGYAQVLWLDAAERKYIEEVGSMNVFFRIGGTVATPALNGSILDGVTRDSVIRLLQSWRIPVEERPIAIGELLAAHDGGSLVEAFGTGTAAVISAIGTLNWQGRELRINGGRTGEWTARLYDTLTGIQYGDIPDSFGWMMHI